MNLLYSRYGAKSFIEMISFNPHKDPRRKGLIFPPKDKEMSTSTSGYLPKVMQAGGSKLEFQLNLLTPKHTCWHIASQGLVVLARTKSQGFPGGSAVKNLPVNA